jgi:hypothetical protein
MTSDTAFPLGLIDQTFPAHVAHEDFLGPNGDALRRWQATGFLATEPGRHPAPSCPHCTEDVPHMLGGALLCPGCLSVSDQKHLLLWRFNLDAVLRWLAHSLSLAGAVQQVDEQLWQLGRLTDGGIVRECFFRRSGAISEHARSRLLAFRNALLFTPLPGAEPVLGFSGPSLTLQELLREEAGSLAVVDVRTLLRRGGMVRFDAASGGVWAGDVWLGEAPLGSKEYFFLDYLARNLDCYVSYADLKHYVQERTGSEETTEEATFCQKLKRRIKVRGMVPKIDSLLATTNKGDGYRLRGYFDASNVMD